MAFNLDTRALGGLKRRGSHQLVSRQVSDLCAIRSPVSSPLALTIFFLGACALAGRSGVVVGPS